jgi:hypothetical protein
MFFTLANCSVSNLGLSMLPQSKVDEYMGKQGATVPSVRMTTLFLACPAIPVGEMKAAVFVGNDAGCRRKQLHHVFVDAGATPIPTDLAHVESRRHPHKRLRASPEFMASNDIARNASSGERPAACQRRVGHPASKDARSTWGLHS